MPTTSASVSPSVTLDDIRRFRQLGSHAPGHPEYHWVSGVETTTGPLGQGIATSVGMAIGAEVAGEPLQPARLRHLRLRDLRRVRGRLPDGRRRVGGGLAGWRIWASTTCAGSTTTTTSPSKAAPGSRSPRTSRRASWATAGTCCAWAMPTTSIASSTRCGMFQQTKGRPTLIILDSHIGYGSPQPAGYRRGARRAARAGGGPPHQARVRLAGGRDVPGARRRPRPLRRRDRCARRRSAPQVDRSVRGLSLQVSGARDRDRADAEARAACRMGPRPADVSRRRQGPGRTRRLGQGPQRAGTDHPVVPRRLRGPGTVEQDHAHLRGRGRFPGRHPGRQGCCTSASASTPWVRS